MVSLTKLANIIFSAALLLTFASNANAAPPNAGKIRIKADHTSAWVYVNGKKKGMTPDEGYTDILLSEGGYTILVEKESKDGKWVWRAEREVFVGEDSQTKLKFSLKKQATSKQLSQFEGRINEMLTDIRQRMVEIPAGSFRMGDLSGDGGSNEKPVHRVTVPAFRMSAIEVPFAWYDLYVAVSGSASPSDEGWGRKDRPVINVNWSEASGFVEWLNQVAKPQHPFRLPSEAEWEYAARAGTTTKYWWGDSVGRGNANCNDKCGDRWKKTAPVASFDANRFGLYDTVGNVWEWTQDCWNGSYGGAPSDGSAWESRECSLRVLRGGSWDDHPRYASAANRYHYSVGNRNYSEGFRLAQDR